MTRISEITLQKNTVSSTDLFLIEDGADNNVTKRTTGAAIIAAAPVQSVAGRTGNVTISKSDVGLGSVVNSDTTNASNITSGTLAAGRLPSVNIGTTSVDLTRASGNLSLTGIPTLQMPGATSGGVTLQPAAVAGTTTITLPATTGTVVTTGDSGTVTSTMIANGTIVNEDINSAAAIAGSKISPDFGSQTVTTTGIFSAAAGTAAAPSIAITGDTNTGIYSPGADQVALATGGTGRVFVGSDGNVLIGATGTATRLLTVNQTGTTGGEYGIRVSQQSATSNALEVTIDSTNSVSKIFQKATLPLLFGTNDTERLRIDSSGNVGIGTSSPGSLLHIKSAASTGGNLRFENTVRTYQAGLTGATTGAYLLYDITNSQSAYSYLNTSGHIFYSQDTERLRINSSGTVNIVGGGIAGSTQAVSFDGNAPAGSIVLSSSGRIGFGSGTTAQQVGVGGPSTLPQLALFESTSGNSARLRITVDDTDGVTLNATNTGNASKPIIFTRGISTESLRIDSSGRLLVGTSSAIANLNYQTINYTPKVQVVGPTVNDGSLAIVRTSTSPFFFFGSGASGTNVALNGALGTICFNGYHTDNYYAGAAIQAFVDTTPGADDMGSRLTFSTAADGTSSLTERLRITSTGQVRLAGAGITFNGDTATANELDDYEEGTWTPAFSFSTSGSVTYSAQVGNYTKIGNTVIARASIVLTGVSSPTGNATITGLPFTVSSAPGIGSVGIARNFASAGLPLTVYAGASSTIVWIMKNATNAGTGPLLGSDLTATTQFYIDVIYSV